MTEYELSSLAAVPIGSAAVFHYPGDHDPCLLIRPDAETLLAYSQSCCYLKTHNQCRRFGACPAVTFLSTAMLMRFKVNSFANKHRADAFRTVDFVGGEGGEVDG